MPKKSQTIISAQQIRELRAQLHHVKPIIIIGNNGVTPSLLQEVNRALEDHELIKIRVNEATSTLADLAKQICQKTQATLIQTIGHIIAIYRKNPAED